MSDAEPDLDFDQVPNGEEMLAATDPRAPDAEVYRDARIRYALTDLGELEVTRDNGTDIRHCYDFAVSRIPLVTPLVSTPRGRNRVLLYSLERPVLLAGVEPRVFVACVDALYLGPTEKDPESGVVDWRPEAWARQRKLIYDRLDAIAACDPDSPGPDSYTRQTLDALVDKCLPPRVALGDILWKRDELKALAQELVHSNLSLRSPDEPSALFVPIESFEPQRDCYRPGRVKDLIAFLDLVFAECTPCTAPPESDE